MKLGFKLRPKWWYPITLPVMMLYEIWRWVTFQPMSEADIERIALWVVDHAMTIEVDIQ